ncbi:exopolysaccharide transport family protein [Rhodoflexus sp.]
MELYLIFRALYRKKFWLIGLSLVVMTLAYFLAARFDRLYQSSTKIATGFTVVNKLEQEEKIGGFYETDLKFNNLIENLNSPIVIGQLSYRLIINDLTEPVPFQNPLTKEGKPLLNAAKKEVLIKQFRSRLAAMRILNMGDSEDRQLLEILEKYGYSEKQLRDVIQVYRNGFTDYVTIAATTDNPQLSAFIVNTIFEEFSRYNNTVNTIKASETVERLDSLLKAKQQAKELAMEAYKEYQRTANLIDLDIEGDAALKQISSLEEKITDEQTKLRRAELALIEVEAKIAKLEEDIKGNAQSSTSGNQAIRKLNQTLVILEQRRKRNPDSQSIRDSIIMINTELSRLGASPVAGINATTRLEELYDQRSENRTQIATSRQTLETLNNRLKAVAGTKSTFAQKGARIKLLQENLDLASKEYEEVLQRYNKVLEGKNFMSGIKQVIVGQPAQESQRSKRLLITLIAGAGALLIALMVIVLLEFIDNRLRTPSIFTSRTKVPLIAVLPVLNMRQHSPESLFEFPLAKEASPSVTTKEPAKVLAAGLNFKRRNAVQQTTEKLFKENIRLLRYQIESSGKKVCLFSSLQSGKGKTTIIRSLAGALVRAGKRVLIIDANFANNELSKIYEAQLRIENVLKEINLSYNVIPSSDNGNQIRVIGCQGGDHSLWEIASAAQLQRLISFYAQLYDFILIECADMAHHADLWEIKRHVDMIVCVISAEEAPDQRDMNHLAQLKKQEAFLGTVLNMVAPENIGY